MKYLKFEENINGWLRLLILLYTNGMVVFAKAPHERQEGINAIEIVNCFNSSFIDFPLIKYLQKTDIFF